MNVICCLAFFAAIAGSQMTSAAQCTSTPNCESTAHVDPTIKITLSDINKLLCSGVNGKDIHSVYWIRNNSDGDSKRFNFSAKNITISVFLPTWTIELTDSPPQENASFTYQCVAVDKCCKEIKTQPIKVKNVIPTTPASTPRPTKKKIQIFTHIRPSSLYAGFGKIELSCSVLGDNKTKVYWIRKDKHGGNVTLNSTKLVAHGALFQAVLIQKPNKSMLPLQYVCVFEDECCETSKSTPMKITYEKTGDCPSLFVLWLLTMTPDAQKRSVNVTWVYETDPEVYGFEVSILDTITRETITNATVDVSARHHIFHGLVPYKYYGSGIAMLFGNGCKSSLRAVKPFQTKPDYPEKPRNVTVIVSNTALNVSWQPPKYWNGNPKGYRLSWRKANTSQKYEAINVTQFTSHFVIKEQIEYEAAYTVEVQAINDVGYSRSSSVTVELTGEAPPEPSTDPPDTTPSPAKSSTDKASNTGAIAGGVVGALILAFLVVVALLFIRKRIADNTRKNSIREFQPWRNEGHADNSANFHSLDPDIPRPIPDPVSEKSDCLDENISYIELLADWEISPKNLKLLEKKLGGGQFGIVKQGLWTNMSGEEEVVAVKMLKDGANESNSLDLMTELKILKDVNKQPHPNVIRLIGACSVAGQLLVVTEFCSGGDLRRFLLRSRVEQQSDNSSQYVNITSTLNHRQLLKIASDIANGMVHLSEQKFVHRDLAARNVLIGEDNMAKVSDFGLARDVGPAEEYIRNNQNLLPVKWMAIESLLHGRFTTASDVWSYGILLHEIITLGEEPYKNISPHYIASHVGSGCRMPKPEHCSNEIYELMTNCWKVEPSERPTFSEICDIIRDMLTDDEKSYINISQVIDEGLLSPSFPGANISLKDGSVRYTTMHE